MRECDGCGTENANDAVKCAECGDSLVPSGEASRLHPGEGRGRVAGLHPLRTGSCPLLGCAGPSTSTNPASLRSISGIMCAAAVHWWLHSMHRLLGVLKPPEAAAHRFFGSCAVSLLEMINGHGLRRVHRPLICVCNCSNNFWDIGNYKPVIKRISGGAKLCDELVKMMNERATLEKQYAKSLTAWADRWHDKLDKLKEYGTLKTGWQGNFLEARHLSSIHMQLHDKFDREVRDDVEGWKKVHYPKSFLQFKSYKRAHAAFEKAQTPWAKRKSKIAKHQKALQQHQLTASQLTRAASTAVTDSERSKMQSNAAKEEKEAQKSKEKLQQRIAEMHQYAEIYEKEMRLEFQRCQDEERERIEFFKEMFVKIHRLGDVAGQIAEAHMIVLNNAQQINSEADLASFSREFGPDMPMLLPNQDGNFTSNPAPYQMTADEMQAARNQAQRTAAYQESLKRTSTMPSTYRDGEAISPPPAHEAPPAYASEEFPPAPPAPAAPPAPPMPDSMHNPTGARMRALYDYQGNASDELSFAYGDTITVVPSATPEPGWLQGQLASGAVGKFPANYVEPEESADC
eukprot:m.159572 g.159572  ORF g.159572 m.159572 type:complete len:572 (-) comp10265_c0_seq2:99-1814(-)